MAKGVYYIKSYVSVASARAALSQSLRQMGFSLRDVKYEIKHMKASDRFHPVVDIDVNGKHLVRSLQAQGFVATH